MTDVILAKLETRQSMRERRKFAPPFGLLYIADALERAGFNVILIHEEGTEETIESLVELVLKENPVWVGFSTMTGPTIYPCLKASRAIKDQTDVPVVWGGIHPTIVPEETVMDQSIDIVCIGEGEKTSIEITKTLKRYGLNAEALSKIEGVAIKKKNQVFFTKSRQFIRDLDEFSPSWNHLNMEKYIYSDDYFQYSKSGGNKVMAIITSRGCPWRCGFCYNQAVNKRVFRAHSVRKIVSQIKELKERYGLTGIRFWDDNIFSNPNRALDILRNIELPWISSIRANELFNGGEKLVKTLSQTKCRELNIGVESGSQRILKLIKKDITLEQVRWAARMCGKYRIKACFGFMAGFPGEIWSDICETLQFMEEIEHMNQYSIVRGLAVFTPLPKTPLFDYAVELGFDPPKSLMEWSNYEMGYMDQVPCYADKRVKSLGYYVGLTKREDLDTLTFPYIVKGLQRIAKLRLKHRFFYFPLDHTVPKYVRRMSDRVDMPVLRHFYQR